MSPTMKSVVLVLAVTAASFASIHSIPKLHPLSDAFIEAVGNKKNTWKSGRNFHPNTSMNHINKLASALPGPEEEILKLPIKTHKVDLDAIPEFFDAREAWPECASIIGNIRDQGSCGSCWAFAAAEVMSDRICIHSNATVKVSISAEDLLDCCPICGKGCDGGYSEFAWLYWSEEGVATGGGYETRDGCKAYLIPPCEHTDNLDLDEFSNLSLCNENFPTPICNKECDAGLSLEYESSLTYGSGYRLESLVSQIQMEILTNGPVHAEYSVYEDFMTYKNGVYQKVLGEFIGGHAIKIIGWGVEGDLPYWLVANSWNEYWGDGGYFKILLGSDECGIKNNVFAGIPDLESLDLTATNYSENQVIIM